MEEQIVITVNDYQLKGVLHVPEQSNNKKLPLVIICHGFISSKVGQHRIFVKTARELCRVGFAVLRFDYSGCGESTGEYRDITLTRHIEETIEVIAFAVRHPNIDPDQIVLLGHSLGGGIAASVAGIDKRIKKLILWSPVARPFMDIVGIVGEELYKECLEKHVVNYQGFEVGLDFFDSLAKTHPLEIVKEFHGNVLVVHGTGDVETPVENAYMYGLALYKRSQAVNDVRVIDGADHTYNSPVWERELIGLTLHWLETETA